MGKPILSLTLDLDNWQITQGHPWPQLKYRFQKKC